MIELDSPTPAYCQCGATVTLTDDPCPKCGELTVIETQRWTGMDDNLQAIWIERETE